jgi:hypothetical protein
MINRWKKLSELDTGTPLIAVTDSDADFEE